MTDRELLELAAKAAGIRLLFPITKDGSVVAMVDTNEDGLYTWNPLADDGDALRLAGKLKLDIMHIRNSVRAVARWGDDVVIDVCEIGQVTGDEGVRRVITMAAASIGKALP